MRYWKQGTAATLAALVGLAVAGPVQAGLIPAAVTVAADGGLYRYKYNIQLPSDYRVKAGDFFTIYDFHGFADGVVTPTGWSFTSEALGPYPPGINPNDDPSTANLTWTYGGPDLNVAGSLGLFEALSSSGPGMINGEFASQDHRDIDGRAVGNYTSVDVPEPKLPDDGEPGPGPGPGPGVPETPEPATLVLLGLGLPLAGLARLVRRRRHA